MVRSPPKTSETETPPEWIWLPNALVDGVGVETPPIEIARESGRPAALRLLVDLYAAQSLAENGGVHWRRLRLSYERERVGQQGIYVVWGFTKKTKETWGSVPFVEAHMTPGKDREAGFKTFWEALEILTLAGLVEFVGHVIDHDPDEGAVIHPYSWPNGEPAERDGLAYLVLARGSQGDMRTTSWSAEAARLKYRARSTATAAWMAKTAEWEALAKQFTDLAAGTKSNVKAASC